MKMKLRSPEKNLPVLTSHHASWRHSRWEGEAAVQGTDYWSCRRTWYWVIRVGNESEEKPRKRVKVRVVGDPAQSDSSPFPLIHF